MIVATIGRQQFKLKDIAAAEVLLKILSDSQPIEEHFMRNSRNVFSLSKSAYEMVLTIYQEEIISDETLEFLKAEDQRKDLA